MDEITMPYHILFLLGISICLLVFYFSKRESYTDKNKKASWIAIVVLFLVYSIILTIAIIDDLSYQVQLNNYDLNRDGFFSGEEITPEQEVAMIKLTNDTGRNLSFITGLIFSFFISAIVYLIAKISTAKTSSPKNQTHQK